MQLCIFEDEHFSNFLPLVFFRPVYDLRCGALSLREKIEALFPRIKVLFHTRQELTRLLSEKFPGRMINTFSEEDTWFINGRILADEHLSKFIRKSNINAQVFLKDNDVVAAYVPGKEIQQMLHTRQGELFSRKTFSHIASESYSGGLFSYPWELIHRNSEEIEKDFQKVKKKSTMYQNIHAGLKGVHLLKRENIVVGKNSAIKAGVVLDAEKGPIIIGNNVTLMPNAVVEGPAYIGDHAVIKIGAKIYHGTSIGKWCKVGGEVESSILQSYSNKQHDGFLGHSYLGSWVNIGADTTTSDLKNTYGTVKVYVNGTMVDSHQQFVGLTMGDHSKTGINTMFDTGTVVGVSCNIYGAGTPPKFLPSYSWGEKGAWSEYALDKSIETARRVMARRNVTMSEAYEQVLRTIFSVTSDERRSAGIQ